MQYIDDFPETVESLGEFRIAMTDGAELSATAWLPARAWREPVPAVLEYIPYRLGDSTAVRDSMMHPYFAGHGYAAVRVDLRGSGNSDGVLRDEYLPRELDDGEEVIRWITEQPWCSGTVGIIGISWGGFNGLQLAARRNPAIGGVITVCSTDDRYADDVHYMGGCLLSDNLSWASTMFAYNSCPPDPAVVGNRWREMWKERLEHSGLWLAEWLKHQRRDEYWQYGSVGEDFSRITCPVFAVSGWADGYSNSVFRLLEGLSVPRYGLIGAWGHKYPHMAEPGPAIGFLQECLRFWDRHLAGRKNGIDSEPMLRVWMQDAYDPEESSVRPGRWVAEPQWRSPRIRTDTFALAPWGLVQENGQDYELAMDTDGAVRRAGGAIPDEDTGEELRELTVESPLNVGLFVGKWTSYSADTDLPSDQRLADGGALIFDTAPFEEAVEILGAPVAELTLSANRPVAMVACRVSDVAPDGRATRVTYGLLNLTHRSGHETPQPLEPGVQYTVRVRLNETAQTFRAGHSLRLAVSTSYWPLAWPPPQPVRLRVSMAESRLHVPIRPPREEDAELRAFGPAEAARPVEKRLLSPENREWTVSHNLATNDHILEVEKDEGRFVLEKNDLEVTRKQSERYSYRRNRYDTLRAEVTGVRGFRRGDWHTYSVTRTVLTSTETHFRIKADLDAYEGDARIFSSSWDEEIPRDFV